METKTDTFQSPVEASLNQLQGKLRVLNALLKQRTAERTAFIELLQEIAVAANEALTIQAILQFGVNRTCAYTGWPVGHVYMANPDTPGELVATNIWYLDSPKFETFCQVIETTPFSYGVGLPGKVLASGKPAWITDVTQDPDFLRAKLPQDIGLKAGFAFPVSVGKEVAAVLEFFSHETVEPDESLLELMSLIGTQLGRVIERKRTEDALRESEARFRAIFEGAAIGILLVDQRKRIVESNLVSQILLKYSHKELCQMNFDQLIHPADEKTNEALFQALITGKRHQYQLEIRYFNKNRHIGWGRLTVSPVWAGEDESQFAIVMLEDITEHKQIETELAELRRRLMEGREIERLQLAQELHDGPLQDLHSMFMRLSELEAVLADEASVGQMAATQATLQQVIRTLRSICGELRPSVLAPFGLEKAIRSHGEDFQERYSDIAVKLDLMPDGQTLPEQTRLALFRIYQHAMANVNQHAQAKRVTIRLKLEPKQAILEIEDDGRGFVMPERRVELARQGHYGLVGAVERAEAIGGSLSITSNPGQGTLLQAIVPRSDEQES